MKKLNLFVIALVAMLIPSVLVHAETVECSLDHQAKIGEVCYDTLSSAIAAVQNNETIVLEKSIDASNYVLISRSGINFTIDFNNETLKFTGNDNTNYFGLLVYSQVTLKNGKVISETQPTDDGFAITIASQGNLTLTDMEVESLHRSAIAFFEDNAERNLSLTIGEGSIVKSHTGAGVVAYKNGTYTLNVEGTIINDGTWSAINGSWDSAGTLNVNIGKNANVSSTGGVAILQMAKGKITIEGTVEGYEAGVAMTKGELAVEDGAVVSATGHGQKDVFTPSSDNKIYANGAAIYVEPVDTIKADINGGVITSAEGYAISAPSTVSNQNDKLTISVTDGYFDGTAGAIEVVNYEGDGFVSGGTFAEDVKNEYLIENVQQSQNGVVGKLHDISYSEPDNGTVNVPTNAAEGETVTVECTPNEGFVIDTIVVVTKADGTKIDVVGDQFVMPTDDVIVTVTFKEAPAEVPSTGDNVMTYAVMGTVALVSVLGTALYFKKVNE